MWPHSWCVTWIFRWGPLILSHHPAKFRIDMSCESGDITLFILSLFICHEVSHDFVGGVPSSSITNLLGLVSIGLLELEIMEFFVSIPISISISIPMLRFQCRGLQMAHQRCSIKKAVLTNFTMFIGKHLCWSFF